MSTLASVEFSMFQMDKKERKVFYIAREIMTTERSFVQVLRLVNLVGREEYLIDMNKSQELFQLNSSS